MSSGALAPELARLEREVARDPGEGGAVLALARLRLRCGDRVGAYAALDAFLDRGPQPEAEAMHRQVLASGRYRPVFEPVPVEAPDTGKPRTRHSISALAVDPAESHLAVAKGSGDVYLVPLAGGEARYLGRCGKKKSARAACFAADGSAFYTADATGTVRRWDVASGEMTRASKKLANILQAVAAHRGGLAAASLERRFRIRPDGSVLEEGTDIGQVSRVTAGTPGPGDPLDEAMAGVRGVVGTEFSAQSRYWSEARVFDLHGTGAGLLRDGSLQLYREGAWRTFEDSRLVRRFSVSLAPGGRALAIAQHIEVQRNSPSDPPPRGVRLCLLEDDLQVADLLEDEYVSEVAFSPSGGLLVVGTETGHLFVVPLFEAEEPEAGVVPGGAEASAVEPEAVAWETPGTRTLRPAELSLLGRYGEDEGGFPSVAGKVLGMDDDVVLLGRADEDGKVTLEPTCLALKSGTFEATDRYWSHRRFPHHRAEAGRSTPGWLKVTGETARSWVMTSDERHAAALIRGDAAAVLVVSTKGKGASVRLTAGGPVARVAWSPRGRRLAVLRKDGVVEVYGSVPARSEGAPQGA